MEQNRISINMKLLQILIIAVLFISGCSRQSENSNNEDLQPIDVVSIINITHFIRETDNSVFNIYMAIITNDIKCDQENQNQISNNLNLISQQLNLLNEQFEYFLTDPHSPDYISDIEKSIKKISQTLKQLKSSARDCYTNNDARNNNIDDKVLQI